MQLTAETLNPLAAWSDPVGVLSAYVGFPVGSSDRPTAPIELKKEVRQVGETARERLPRDQWAVVSRRLGELAADLEALVDPSRSGRGRALFAGMSDGRVETVSVQLELPTRVVLQHSPYVVPLLAALERGRPSGLVSVQRDGLHIFEWRFGEVEELAVFPLDIDESDWRQARGPANPNPARSQQSTSHFDRVERRVVANRERLLRQAAGDLVGFVGERHWDRLAVFGDARLGRPLIEAMPARNEDLEVLVDERVIDDSAKQLIHQGATRLLEEADERRELALVQRAKDTSYAGGRGAIGVAPVLDVLNQGRVERLLLDPAARIEGFVGQHGELFPRDGATDLPAAVGAKPEPNLGDHMIRRALNTQAQVTLVRGQAADALRDGGGAAAVLRW